MIISSVCYINFMLHGLELFQDLDYLGEDSHSSVPLSTNLGSCGFF